MRQISELLLSGIYLLPIVITDVYDSIAIVKGPDRWNSLNNLCTMFMFWGWASHVTITSKPLTTGVYGRWQNWIYNKHNILFIFAARFAREYDSLTQSTSVWDADSCPAVTDPNIYQWCRYRCKLCGCTDNNWPLTSAGNARDNNLHFKYFILPRASRANMILNSLPTVSRAELNRLLKNIFDIAEWFKNEDDP